MRLVYLIGVLAIPSGNATRGSDWSMQAPDEIELNFIDSVMLKTHSVETEIIASNNYDAGYSVLNDFVKRLWTTQLARYGEESGDVELIHIWHFLLNFFDSNFGQFAYLRSVLDKLPDAPGPGIDTWLQETEEVMRVKCAENVYGSSDSESEEPDIDSRDWSRDAFITSIQTREWEVTSAMMRRVTYADQYRIYVDFIGKFFADQIAIYVDNSGDFRLKKLHTFLRNYFHPTTGGIVILRRLRDELARDTPTFNEYYPSWMRSVYIDGRNAFVYK